MVNKVHPTLKELTNSWPNIESRDPPGKTARRFVVNLQAAMDGRSVRSVASDSGLDEGSVRRVLAGATWPHLRAIVLLEQSLGIRLYPQ